MDELTTMRSPQELSDEELDTEIITLDKKLEQTEPYFIRYGDCLIEKKERLPHGQFIPWINANCSFGRKTANQYMRLARSNVTRELHLEHESRPLSQRQALERLEIKQEKIVQPWDKPQPEVERQVKELYQKRIQQFDQRGAILEMRVRGFITPEEPTGRDIEEAIKAIDKFDMSEDIELLRKIQIGCEQLAVRAADLARRLKVAIETKEKVI